MRLSPILLPMFLAAICTGCWQDVAPMGPAPKPDTLRTVDTLILRDTVHDTVARPLGPYSYLPPAPSDSMVGDFAPLAIGNERVYKDSSSYWRTSGVFSWYTNRTGTIVIKVIGTECDGNHLTHSLRFEFKGIQRNTQYDQQHNPVMDSTGQDFHAGSLRCLDDGSFVECEGLDCFDAAYLGIFGFHRASVSDLQAGVDPFTGRKAAAILITGNPSAYNRKANGVGTLEFRVKASSGSTCCGFGHTYRASLLSFNGIPALYR